MLFPDGGDFTIGTPLGTMLAPAGGERGKVGDSSDSTLEEAKVTEKERNEKSAGVGSRGWVGAGNPSNEANTFMRSLGGSI